MERAALGQVRRLLAANCSSSDPAASAARRDPAGCQTWAEAHGRVRPGVALVAPPPAESVVRGAPATAAERARVSAETAPAVASDMTRSGTALAIASGMTTVPSPLYVGSTRRS